MTKEQARDILRDLDLLKGSVVETLEGFGSEQLRAYTDMFDNLYDKIENATRTNGEKL